MASVNDSSNSKRRRLEDSVSLDARCLHNLPSGILTHVAKYLAPPSQALFAAALIAADQNAASDERNSTIVGNEWSTLDFGDIEKELAVKLSDNHIREVLQSIDAVNRLKTLKLTNCINITGAGLEPLRGSTTIEQIDLSLVGKHQSRKLKPDPPISCDHVLPILDSIIVREGCALQHLQFPSKWLDRVGIRYRNGRQRELFDQFVQFLRRCNGMWDNRGGISCLKCNSNSPTDNGSWIVGNEHTSDFGYQKYTCYECLKHTCERCTTDDDSDFMLRYCKFCEKYLCGDCEKMKWCSSCKYYCVDCTEFTECAGCDANMCKECVEGEECCTCERHFCDDCNAYMHCLCDHCKKFSCDDCEDEYISCDHCLDCFCDDCNKKKGIDAIQFCKSCETMRCGACRVDTCREEDCSGCMLLAGPKLFDENKKLRNENKEVRAENKELKDKIEKMQSQRGFGSREGGKYAE